MMEIRERETVAIGSEMLSARDTYSTADNVTFVLMRELSQIGAFYRWLDPTAVEGGVERVVRWSQQDVNDNLVSSSRHVFTRGMGGGE